MLVGSYQTIRLSGRILRKENVDHGEAIGGLLIAVTSWPVEVVWPGPGRPTPKYAIVRDARPGWWCDTEPNYVYLAGPPIAPPAWTGAKGPVKARAAELARCLE